MKTTITGLLLACFTALKPYLETGEVDFEKNWASYLIAVMIAGLGYFAQDSKNSSEADKIGTRPNDR